MNDLEGIIDEAFPDDNWASMWRGRPYLGQSWTDSGKRGQEEIKGITFRDLRDCYIRAVFLSTGRPAEIAHLYDEADKGDEANLSSNDIFGIPQDVWNGLDPIAVAQNLSCEIEKIMGIFPNIEDRSTEDIMKDVPVFDLDCSNKCPLGDTDD